MSRDQELIGDGFSQRRLLLSGASAYAPNAEN